MTGFLLYFVVLAIIWYMALEIYLPNCSAVAMIKKVTQSIFGYLLLLAWMTALYYHSLNGIRHLFWDMGKGFAIKSMHRSALLVIIGTAILAIFSCCFIFKY